MKNLVIIHMESVSRFIFQMNPEQFPNMRRFQKRCMNYKHYYATATSTAMVLNDITYGDLYRIENTEFFGDFIATHQHAESFIDVLQKRGYQTLGIHYPCALGNEINPGHMYAQHTDLVNYGNYEKAFADVKKVIDQAEENKQNFLIYFCNEVSHLCYGDDKKFHIKNPADRWHYGYRTIDRTVGDLIGYLEERKRMSDTVIILYGDHGDDFYGHDYNGGYAHSIEPYEHIVHTPFMIYDESVGSGETDDLICSLDIKQLVYNLVGADLYENKFIFDRYHSKREYVFSRNLFAGQIPQKINGYISNVRKSYGIATPEYNLILTEQGYRMYLSKMDSTNSNNVLDYFYLHKGKLRHICDIGFLFVHYRSFMGYGTIGELQRNFRKLSGYMRRELTALKTETGLKEIISLDSERKIHYTKNMFVCFAVLRYKYWKKQIKNKLDKYDRK